MAWTTTPYCILTDVKVALGLSAHNNTNDAFIALLIPAAQASIDRYVGYSFQSNGTVASPVSRLYSGNGKEQLMIDGCQQITRVLETNYNIILGYNGLWQNGTAQTMDITADTVLGPDNYPTPMEPGYMIYRLTGLPFMEGKQNYQISGIWGYTQIPSDIQYACIRLVIHNYKKRETNYANVLAENSGMREIYNTKSMPTDVVEILEMYRHKNFFSGA